MLSLTKVGDSWRLAARARRDACKAPPPGPALGLGRMLNDSARSPQRYTSRRRAPPRPSPATASMASGGSRVAPELTPDVAVDF